MAASTTIVLCAVTVFWVCVGIMIPVFVARGPNQQLIRCCLLLASVCCWLLWLCIYIAQINPLIGPAMRPYSLIMINKEWK